MPATDKLPPTALQAIEVLGTHLSSAMAILVEAHAELESDPIRHRIIAFLVEVTESMGSLNVPANQLGVTV